MLKISLPPAVSTSCGWKAPAEPPQERTKAARIHQMVLEAPQRRSTPNIHAMATRRILPKGRNFH